jgi:hypothetical protein
VRAKRGGKGNVPEARVFLDRRTRQPVRVEVWRDGQWQVCVFHTQAELPFERPDQDWPKVVPVHTRYGELEGELRDTPGKVVREEPETALD